MQEPMDNILEARDEPTVVGMVHLPGKNDVEWEEFKKRLRTPNVELSDITLTQRTATEEARMRDALAQGADAEEEGEHPDWA